jgi:hypothetical protein
MSQSLNRAVLASLAGFGRFAGVTLYPWQLDAFGSACERSDGRFRYRLAAVSVPRGNGKSYAAALVGLWRLIAGPAPQDIVSCALDLEGSRVVLDHAKRILRACPTLESVVDIQASSLSVPDTGSRWTITSREHTASRGRHPSVILYDECGWARDDELFSSLLAGQASVPDPLMLVVSTVGRRQSGPLWTIKQLADGGDTDVLFWHSPNNDSPLVTTSFLKRQHRILSASQYAREHQNQWIDAADSFCAAEDVDFAMSRGWREQHAGAPDGSYQAAVDLGLVSDPTVIGVSHRDTDGVVYLDCLLTFHGSRRRPVDLGSVEDALVSLSHAFPLQQIRIESWQGASIVQRLQALGLPTVLYTPTLKAQQDEWPVLAHALAERRLALYPHAQLREELLSLTVEVGPQGARVVDRGRVHQDHATVLRMLVAATVQHESFVAVDPGRDVRTPLMQAGLFADALEDGDTITYSSFEPIV